MLGYNSDGVIQGEVVNRITFNTCQYERLIFARGKSPLRNPELLYSRTKHLNNQLRHFISIIYLFVCFQSLESSHDVLCTMLADLCHSAFSCCRGENAPTGQGQRQQNMACCRVRFDWATPRGDANLKKKSCLFVLNLSTFCDKRVSWAASLISQHRNVKTGNSYATNSGCNLPTCYLQT